MIDQYLSDEKIQGVLIRIRCKMADQRHRASFAPMLCSSSVGEEYKPDIYALFPPRRKWPTLSEDERKERYECTSIDNNILCLTRKVNKENHKEGEHPDWYNNLQRAVSEIREMIQSPKLKFKSLHISAEEKERDNDKRLIVCRPICSFQDYKERAVISLLNKILTELFDSYFQECSFAFRSSEKKEKDCAKDKEKTPAHIKAVQKIIDFRKLHKNTPLWVAECDLKKFYDTIDHDVIIDSLQDMLQRCVSDSKINIDESNLIENGVRAYLDCYNFYFNVLQYNTKPYNRVWKVIPRRTGFTLRFEWVEKDIDKIRDRWPYRTGDHEQHSLGVPQGGAISGLIANLILNRIDEKIVPYVDPQNLIYLRFCDDMIIIGVEKEKVEKVFGIYQQTARELHLFQHDPDGIIYPYTKDHWSSKTKEPYRWEAMPNGGIPWVSFVGIDVRHTGQVRIRRKTIIGHVKKQEKVVWEVLRSMKNKNPRYSKEKTLRIVQGHLDAMGVGKIEYWNYKNNPNTGSWCNAFKVIDNNRWSRHQLKILDRHKQSVIHKFNKKISTMTFPKKNRHGETAHSVRFTPEMRGKPCSYFGQVLKLW